RRQSLQLAWPARRRVAWRHAHGWGGIGDGGVERDREGDRDAARPRSGGRARPRRPPRGAVARPRRLAPLPPPPRSRPPHRRPRPPAAPPPRTLRTAGAPRAGRAPPPNRPGPACRGCWGGGVSPTAPRHMDLNFDAVVRLTEALLPLLRRSTPSAIVNVAST